MRTETMLVVAATILASAVAASSPMTGTWLDVNDTFSPRDKFGLTCTASGAADVVITLFGGRESSSVYLSDVHQYSTATSQWEHLYPVAETSGVAAMGFGRINDLLWTYGGQVPSESDETRSYNLTSLEWVTYAATSATPTARRRPGSWVVNNHLVVFAGLTGAAASNEVYALDSNTATWSRWHDGTGTAPTPRFDPCCVMKTATVTICFGGTTATGDVNDVWEFDNTAFSWTQRTTTGDTPSERRLAMCSIHNGELLVWAGWDSGLGIFVSNTTLHFLDLTTFNWRGVAQNSALETRDSGGMCAANGRVFLMGGARSSGRSNELFELQSSGLFTLVVEGGARPPARAFHNSFVIGDSMYVLFGINKATGTLFNDMWRYNTTTRTWSEVSVSGTVPSARRSACVAMRGFLAVVFGGHDGSSSLSDVWFFNVDTSTWTQQTTQGVSPGSHSEHVCWFQSQDVLVTGLGKVSGVSDTAFFAYRLTDQTWTPVTSRTGTSPWSRSHAFGIRLNDTHGMVGLGIGSATYNDRWTLSGMTYNSATREYEGSWNEVPSTIPSGASTREYIRGEAAVAASGNHLLICGGAVSSSFPAPIQSICFTYNALTGENVPFTGAAYAMSGASASYIGDTMYVFGGQLSSSTVKRNLFVRTLQAAKLSTICSFGNSDDASCVHCSPGSINPSCSFASEGSYATTAFESANSCAPGDFQTTIGASSALFCVKCPSGTYAPTAGSSSCLECPSNASCPLGTATPLASSALTRPFSDGVSQPGRMAVLQVPWALVAIIILAMVLMFVLMLVFLYIHSRIAVRSLDLFSDGHRSGFVNTDLRVVKTDYGGVIFTFSVIAMIVITVTLITNHFYDNLTENKGSVPQPVIQSLFQSDTIIADMDVTVALSGPTRVVEGLSGGEAHCLEAGTTSVCRGSAAFTSSAATVGSLRLVCSWDATYDVCTMTAFCQDCTVPAGTSQTFRFTFPAGFSAEYIDTTVEVTSGIRDPEVGTLGGINIVGNEDKRSIIQQRFRPSNINRTLSGFPATQFPVTLTPTFFVAPSTLIHSEDQANPQNRFRSTGYHADHGTTIVEGNTVNPYSFQQYFGVPVDITFSVDTTTLLVERSLRVSEVELVSSVLGAVTGCAAFCLVMMQIMDKHWFKSMIKRCCGGDDNAYCRCLWLDLDGYAEEEMKRVVELKRYHPALDDAHRHRRMRLKLLEQAELDAYKVEIGLDSSSSASAPSSGSANVDPFGNEQDAVIMESMSSPPPARRPGDEGTFSAQF